MSRTSSSRICACTITSRAVVGSSASSTFGLQASAIAIAARWRMPPENSCGKRSAARAGDADQLEQLAPPAPGRRGPRRCRAAPSARRSGEPIVLTGLNAFMAPWKTIAMSRQRCGADRLLALRQHVLAVEQHPAGDAGARRQQAHQRQDGGRLAAAGLAHEAHPLARPQVEADALDGVQLAPPWRSNHTCRSSTSSTGALLTRSRASRAAAAAGTGAPTGGRPAVAG